MAMYSLRTLSSFILLFDNFQLWTQIFEMSKKAQFFGSDVVYIYRNNLLFIRQSCGKRKKKDGKSHAKIWKSLHWHKKVERQSCTSLID